MISFTKSKLPFGWLGNMSPYSIEYENKKYNTAEALFQSLRFTDEVIKEKIRLEKSPMGAKFVAKENADKMSVEPLSEQDFKNMQLCLELKIEQHPNLLKELLSTKDEEIIEDVTNRPHGRNLVWGAAFINGKWIGENVLGKLWMKIREQKLNASIF
jgi:predicted NAD-dependent protein-ADP-ribosyltransferase YbiA (DUF1768 family)